jgi:SAM-dependent methyltransferase
MDDQEMFGYLMDLHRDGMRQGPGSNEETLRALGLARLDTSAALQLADIGCGTGASTLALAGALSDARITAVDLFPEFLDILTQRARTAGVAGRIQTLAGAMDSLPFADDSLDLIWSEGAIYNMGFASGIKAWRPMLRRGGVIAVSEITWLRPQPPREIWQHWSSEYPGMATAAENIAVLEHAGYDVLGYFVLPPACWTENYYQPTQTRLPAFLARHAGDPQAREVADMEMREFALYRQYQEWFGYGFYVARKN